MAYEWERSSAKLERGEVVRFGHPAREYKVTRVGPMGAEVHPLKKQRVQLPDGRVFLATGEGTIISAHSEVERRRRA